MLGIGTLMLLDHPDEIAKLKEDASLVPSAVEELLRFNGPVSISAPRFAKEDVTRRPADQREMLRPDRRRALGQS